MVDRRELILARLFETLQGIEGLKTIVRNRGELPEDLRPSLVMLDANEVSGTQVSNSRGGRGLAAQPVLVTMRPEIFVVLDQREPKNEQVGEDLNAWRIKILQAVEADTQLNTLLTTNGSLVYEGCLTDLATGQSMQGQLQIQFALSYPFKASDFAAP